MKWVARILAALAPVVLAELLAGWWMSGGHQPPEPVLEVALPEDGWRILPEDFAEVRPVLRCSSGWIVENDPGDGTLALLSMFRWDGTDTRNTLEAFKHLPEQCMGSIGMELEKIHPRRVLDTPRGDLIFDSTQFRAAKGARVVHVFKCVWVHGHPGSDLRGGALKGWSRDELRRLRLAAAVERFRPRHTRVIMGAVTGVPTESLAWQDFRELLEDELCWIPASGS